MLQTNPLLQKRDQRCPAKRPLTPQVQAPKRAVRVRLPPQKNALQFPPVQKLKQPNMKKQKPRFFCDNCGYEVGSDVKACPYCGRFFSSVRCPSCDYSGTDRMFQNGCPMCGYSVPSELRPFKEPKAKKQRRTSEPLPSWVLIAAFIGLGLIVLLLTFLITML